jgi:hypothetical protein
MIFDALGTLTLGTVTTERGDSIFTAEGWFFRYYVRPYVKHGRHNALVRRLWDTG